MSTHKNSPSEMRKHVRVDVPGIVRMAGRQPDSEFGRLVNISEEGLMILTTEPVVENTIFQLTLEFSNDAGDIVPVEIGVESLWCNKGNNEDQFWAGFFIIDISEQNQERIRQLIG
jgi:PilZ domain